MKSYSLIAIFLLIFATEIFAQQQEKFVVNPGQKISDVLKYKDIYEFPQFENGTVEFVGEDIKVEALLNYNLLTQTVQFISPKGDTLSLADEQLIKSINIGDRSYTFKKGYYEVAGSFESNKLLIRKRITVASVKKIGLYDQPVEGGANTYSNFSTGATDVNLVLNQKTTLVKEEACFFSDKNGKVYTSSKKNLLNLLTQHRADAEKFIENESINFNNISSVQKLVKYVGSL